MREATASQRPTKKHYFLMTHRQRRRDRDSASMSVAIFLVFMGNRGLGESAGTRPYLPHSILFLSLSAFLPSFLRRNIARLAEFHIDFVRRLDLVRLMHNQKGYPETRINIGLWPLLLLSFVNNRV